MSTEADAEDAARNETKATTENENENSAVNDQPDTKEGQEDPTKAIASENKTTDTGPGHSVEANETAETPVLVPESNDTSTEEASVDDAASHTARTIIENKDGEIVEADLKKATDSSSDDAPTGTLASSRASNGSTDDSEPIEALASKKGAASATATTTTLTTSTTGAWWLQLWALLIKNGWTRLRTPTATFFELTSPLLMMLVLVAAHNLSDIEYKQAELFSDLVVVLPGSYVSLAFGFLSLSGIGGDTVAGLDFSSSDDRRERQLWDFSKDFDDDDDDDDERDDDYGAVFFHDDGMVYDEYITGEQTITKSVNDDIWDSLFAGLQQKIETLQTLRNGGDRGDDEEDGNHYSTRDDITRNARWLIHNDGTNSADEEERRRNRFTYSLLDDVQRQIGRLLVGPMPVPSFDQFVGASQLIGNAIGIEDLPRVFADSSFGRQWGNLLTLGTIHLTPRKDPIVDQFWMYLNETYPQFLNTSLTIRVHDDEEAALEFIDNNLDERTWALLDFSTDRAANEEKEKEVRFKLRMNYTTIPNTNEITDYVTIGLNRRYQGYYLSGYLTLQRTINEFIMSREEGCAQDLADVGSLWSMPMPTAEYNQNPFFLEVGFLLGLTLVMAFLYPTSRLIKSIVEEKESKMKETLFILGLRGWVHWLSWFVTSVLVFGFITVTCTLALSRNVIKFSDPKYLYWYIGLFASSTVGFCFTLAAVFSRAKLAAIIGPMALFATILPRFIFFGFNRYEATTGKMIASLLPSTAFAFGADIVADYEYAEVGVQEWNVNEGDYSFTTTLRFLFFDTFLYFFLGWYLEQVMPRDYGTRQPFYFLFTPKYWLSFFVAPKPTAGVEGDAIDPEQDATAMEHVDESQLYAGVRIHNLTKQYRPDQPLAVNNLNLSLYESQVTSLLGSNGAGKTSTVSILTGLLRPTSGDCLLYGNSIVSDPAIARRSLGICPQHNILFDNLTVTEHLYFFLRIKGITPNAATVRSNAEEVGLKEFLKTTSIALSGGNKRKLSVAIALSGDPSVLVLDEPTSAMDPHSRRAIWDLIREKRLNRVTFLTTHFMDEAETLSDRIAIMKEGRLQCVGSPLFLKDRFGLGYNLTLVLEDELEDSQDCSAITSFLQLHIPGSELLRLSGKELTYRFPQGSEKSFPDAFDALEQERARLGIGAFGVTNSSLEEVFLELARDTGDSTLSPYAKSESPDTPDATEVDASESQNAAIEYLSPLSQIALLYKKRLTVQKRDGKGACFAIVVPVIVMALVLLVLMIEPPFLGPKIEASPDLYRATPDGGFGETDVVVGSGRNSVTRNQTISKDQSTLTSFAAIEELFGGSYDHVTVSKMAEEDMTSSQMSRFLLETYNDRDHHVRFGAFVFEDTIDFKVIVDWVDMRSLLLSILLGEEASLPAEIKITVADLENLVYILTLSDPNSLGFNTTYLQPIVQQSIADILASATVDVGDIAGEFQEAVQSAIEQTLATFEFNETNLDLGDLASNLTEQLENGNFTGFLETAQGQLGPLLGQTGNDDGLGAVLVNQLLANAAVTAYAETSFDREVVVGSYDAVLIGIQTSLALDLDWNSTEFIESTIDTFYSEVAANNSSERLNFAVVAPLLVFDGILSTVNNPTTNGTDPFIDFLGLLSQSLGGSTDDLDGYIIVTISDLEFNLETQAVEIGATVSSPNGTLFYNISWTSPDGSLGAPASDTDSDIRAKGNYLESENTTSLIFPIRTRASILHNASSPHAVAAFNQAFLQHLHNQCSDSATTVRSFNEPLPLTTQQSIEVKTILSILATLFLLIPFCYIPGAFVVFLVKERISKSKHLQLVSGVNMTSYWVANYVWDLSLFFLLTLLTMAVFLMYGSDSAEVFVGSGRSFLASMLLFFGYGASVLPFSYIFVRNFDNPSSAQISIIGIIFITGFVAVNAYFIMSSLENTKELAESLRPLFRTWPAYNVGEGYINLATSFFEREILGEENDVFDWEVAGKSLCLLYVLAPVYFFVLLLFEYSQDGGSGGALGSVLRNVKRAYDRTMLHWSMSRMEASGRNDVESRLEPDLAVQEEARIVKETKDELVQTAPIVIHNLWKIYAPSTGFLCAITSTITRALWSLLMCCRASSKERIEDSSLPKPAVRGTSLAVREGETLGLLGKNGCGKSTTLNILTGDIPPTSGEAYVAGHSISGGRGVAQARKRIGFCPQTDPLIDLMTGRETLTMFARLRGVKKDQIDTVVQNLMDRLTLTPHADKVSSAYSGGNKRKLSLGVAALVGHGGALLVDESSSGMDPGARRKMWTLMQELAKRRSVVLTTHSMEEAEALCSRIAVMDRGRFVAMGSVQQLKTKYLDGYTIDMNFSSGTPDDVIDAAIADLTESVLPGSTISEQYGRFLRFNVDGVSKLGLGTTFRHLQEFKASKCCVESYSVSQCTLEQVFLKLVEDASADSEINGTTNETQRQQ